MSKLNSLDSFDALDHQELAATVGGKGVGWASIAYGLLGEFDDFKKGFKAGIHK
ncbi:ComC/BlpC family leader-containing pheromone/bacteriocin [Weissella muntiaci]|uniref:ComC/BlpC family leader-containing pheromone/bacteriocin n=1 Tax=Weissella muntiaci TaxID=2508881 RepID=UPI00165259CC|nr:ComC/BlpC family leader-containing pheromone/bacteriocin [Weissella muntiaci]